ncbi:hypothetical protein LCM02_00585 [Lutimonas saemankumensis]|uniref:hypothetical protein n=1 Tax=Lutimonas saemankumensis TaxID=483016 RepID=UPI001CD77362|nr:hypothetical protein [Lutimonas saemankumensis]MCA0930924.1 hypothetical protein [Lutimonas saemankumensis]
MQKLAPLFLCLFILCSCKSEKSERVNSNDNTQVNEIDSSQAKSEKSSSKKDLKNEKILVTSSGKKIKVQYAATSDGLTNINIVPVDFENTSDTFSLADADPVQKLKLDDLDNNGFDELYIVTVSSGSGSYATIYGFASNNDLSLSPVYFPEISEDDLSTEGNYYGYMGHDSIYFENNRLLRKFPIYKDGDANCCPTGGEKILRYKLVPGEASWRLNIEP